jgi:hypothetical protein
MELGQTFTLSQLKQRTNQSEWQKACYRLLDNYSEQNMFSDPMEAPDQTNVHHMLWRYNIKMCGTRKARMVCDGAPRWGVITLGTRSPTVWMRLVSVSSGP